MKRMVVVAVAGLMSGLVAWSALAAGPARPLFDDASIARGGRLYDNWAHESKEREPVQPHPAFSTRQVRVAAADTWRCVECHGWDYKGRHGMVGIRNRQGGDPAAIVAVLKSPSHGYEGVIHENDLSDLANFVTRGQMDMPAMVDAARRLKTAASFDKRYATICANCHGFDGGRLREVAHLGDTARQHPNEVLHVVLNGHAGGNMPALRTFGKDMAIGMLAYLQTLPTLNLAASIVSGGRFYDDWQADTGRKQALPHPAYPPQAYYANAPATTWRCKECHGWDYKGNQGQYAKGNHATGIKGIRTMAGADPEQIMAILRNRTHFYGAVLKYRDLQDLANFVSHGQLDMDTAIDPQTRQARGEAKRGEAYYQTMCAGCHGLDGRFVGKPFLGRLARTDPWEALHAMLNGHPDDTMPALREIDRKVLIDLLAHIQSLQDKR